MCTDTLSRNSKSKRSESHDLHSAHHRSIIPARIEGALMNFYFHRPLSYINHAVNISAPDKFKESKEKTSALHLELDLARWLPPRSHHHLQKQQNRERNPSSNRNLTFVWEHLWTSALVGSCRLVAHCYATRFSICWPVVCLRCSLMCALLWGRSKLLALFHRNSRKEVNISQQMYQEGELN